MEKKSCKYSVATATLHDRYFSKCYENILKFKEGKVTNFQLKMSIQLLIKTASRGKLLYILIRAKDITINALSVFDL